MSVKVFITIDTEEDSWGEWDQCTNSVDNVSQIPILQSIFDRYKAFPTYLVNYPVATNKNAIKVFSDIIDKGRCEIGAHCHPWNTPPFEEEINVRNTMICNLPYNLIYKKLEVLHRAITDGFNVVPVCFRAGRWGFGDLVAEAIYNLDYRLDTSVTPFIDWKDEGGPDFSEASTFPYRFDTDDILSQRADGCLWEVPCTIGFLQENFGRCNNIRNWILNKPLRNLKLLGILDKLRILNLRWLSPELSSSAEMIRLSKNFIHAGHRTLNMSFHSTSLLPGKSPFVRNEKDFQKFLKSIEAFLQYCVDEDMDFSGLSKISDNETYLVA